MTERVNPLGINVVQDSDGYKLYTFHELIQPPMNNQHPITPPPELVQQWREESSTGELHFSPQYLATQAARWGADQELEACCEWFQEFYKTESWVKHDLKHFRAARRPKPPSLKEQALAVLENEPEADDMKELVVFDVNQVKLIRKALEQLDD